MPVYNNWTIKIENSIFSLFINRPDKKNAFNSEVINELSDIIDQEIYRNLVDIRVIIISTKLDNYFTVGLDINWLITLNEKQAREMTENLQDLYNRIEKIPIPVIVAVKGINLTAGFELMLCADMIFAADNSKFGQVETKWGLTPAAGATQRLTRFVGPLNAKDLIYTSRIIDADEALQMGLINKVIPLSDIEAYVLNFAKKMIKNSAKAITLSKKMINKGFYKDPEGFKMEGNSFYECFKNAEPIEKLKKFLGENK